MFSSMEFTEEMIGVIAILGECFIVFLRINAWLGHLYVDFRYEVAFFLSFIPIPEVRDARAVRSPAASAIDVAGCEASLAADWRGARSKRPVGGTSRRVLLLCVLTMGCPAGH